MPSWWQNKQYLWNVTNSPVFATKTRNLVELVPWSKAPTKGPRSFGSPGGDWSNISVMIIHSGVLLIEFSPLWLNHFKVFCRKISSKIIDSWSTFEKFENYSKELCYMPQILSVFASLLFAAVVCFGNMAKKYKASVKTVNDDKCKLI